MKNRENILNIISISMGFIFLWAFFDKLLGLGFATAKDKAWIAGGSPTTGFLTHGVKGPLAGVFNSLAGVGLVDWLFMLGLLFVGLTLCIGIGLRAGAGVGVIMLVLMYLALLLPENNPIIDDHIIYSLVLIYLIHSDAGQYSYFGKKFRNRKNENFSNRNIV